MSVIWRFHCIEKATNRMCSHNIDKEVLKLVKGKELSFFDIRTEAQCLGHLIRKDELQKFLLGRKVDANVQGNIP